jgi:hypothetical protein
MSVLLLNLVEVVQDLELTARMLVHQVVAQVGLEYKVISQARPPIMVEVVAGAVLPLGLPGMVVQVVEGMAQMSPVLREQQIRAVAVVAAERLAGLVARAL